MNQVDELFKRASLHQIREFLISGLEDTEPEENYKSYDERLTHCREPIFNRLKQVYSDPVELDSAIADLYPILTTYENVYLEVGMKAGARLFFELLSSDTIIKPMLKE